MELEDVQKEVKDEFVTVRISNKKKKWMEERKVNPALFFNMSLSKFMKDVENAEKQL